MMNAVFDFTRIGTMEDFYKTAISAMQLPENFGNNLDALWDVITGGIALPAGVEFINMSLTQLETFAGLITLMEDAQDELGEAFTFSYYVQNDYTKN